MAFLKGRDGLVKMGDPLTAALHLQSWNVDEEADEVRGWGMGDSYETAFTTVRRWKGSFEVYIDDTVSPASYAVGAEVDLQFYPGGEASGLPYYSGTAAITGVARSGAKDGIPMVTINFAGRGALTATTVA